MDDRVRFLYKAILEGKENLMTHPYWSDRLNEPSTVYYEAVSCHNGDRYSVKLFNLADPFEEWHQSDPERKWTPGGWKHRKSENTSTSK